MALDTFNPYLFVSAGEQSNKYLTPTITNGIAQFQAQRVQALSKLLTQIDPVQEGTGDPSPDNIRLISGRTGLTVTVQSGETQNEYPVTWQTEAGTIYGGTLDVVSGVLKVTHEVVELNENMYWYKGSTQPTGKSVFTTTQSPGIVDAMSHYKHVVESFIVRMGAFTYFSNLLSANVLYICASDTDSMTVEDFKDYIVAQRTAGTPIQIYYRLATPTVYQLSPTDVNTLAGFNQIYSDAGPVIDIKF